ncbi:MAG: methyltransferase domain-containing protein [Gammaproteobacteria bacterium]|nr:methyltransferase domain-containing protein [Gammaproteobacteria bacterium]MCP5136967.1 methyltransferase domain-containing protein [Gammaproteobacteria bacterium]
MTASRLAAIEIAIDWQSKDATHRERVYFEKVNFWRDFFPGTLGDRLANSEIAAWVSEENVRCDLIEDWSSREIVEADCAKIVQRRPTVQPVIPKPGRFYPRALFGGIPNVVAEDLRVMRVIGKHDNLLRFDLNHPMSRYPLTVSGRVVQWLGAGAERGGRCNDIVLDCINAGPGMQAALDGGLFDLDSDSSFQRLDPSDDARAWHEVHPLLDAEADRQMSEMIGHALTPGMRVLDLMSGSDSHIPESICGIELIGIGLNRGAMSANKQLSEFVIQDVNTSPELPWPDDHFDAVIGSFAFEYLADPAISISELARITRPRGTVLFTFTDQFHPGKCIGIWNDLHPFERVGLILEMFRRDGHFDALHSETARFFPRPEDDPEFQKKLFSDSVYTAWATKRS